MQYNHHPLGCCEHGNLGATCEICPHTHPEITRPVYAALVGIAGYLIWRCLRKSSQTRHKNPYGGECRYYAQYWLKRGHYSEERTTQPFKARSIGEAKEKAQYALDHGLKKGEVVQRLRVSHLDC